MVLSAALTVPLLALIAIGIGSLVPTIPRNSDCHQIG